ncbi:MAG: hypothetical protein AAB481_04965 [Patescibacteria group bacterium]
MVLEVQLSPDISELPKLSEFVKTEPVSIRAVSPEREGDIATTQQWDQESAGALNPFESTSREPMSEKELLRWMTGDERHMLRGVFEGTKDVGFVYAYDDLDGRKRLRYLQSHGLVSSDAAHRELNWWTDRATGEQAESGIAQTLLEVFEKHHADQLQKKTKHPLVILLYVENDDLSVDGALAGKLGFKEMKRQFSYDNPGVQGTDTVYMLTEERFAQALTSRIARVPNP